MKHTMAYLSGDAGSSHSDDHIRSTGSPSSSRAYQPMERKY